MKNNTKTMKNNTKNMKNNTKTIQYHTNTMKNNTKTIQNNLFMIKIKQLQNFRPELGFGVSNCYIGWGNIRWMSTSSSDKDFSKLREDLKLPKVLGEVPKEFNIQDENEVFMELNELKEISTSFNESFPEWRIKEAFPWFYNDKKELDNKELINKIEKDESALNDVISKINDII